MNFIDIGLRLDDVEDLDLVSEPVEIDGDLDTRAEMLSRHGATEDEINFLLGWNDATQKYDHSLTKRVELNAMASRQFIEFIEQKLIEHGVEKLVPKRDIIEQHARRMIEQKLTKNVIDQYRDEIAAEAVTLPLPEDLVEHVRDILEDEAELPWDEAVAIVLRGAYRI